MTRPERLASLVRAAEKAGKTVIRARVTPDGEVVLEFATGTEHLAAVDFVEWKK